MILIVINGKKISEVPLMFDEMYLVQIIKNTLEKFNSKKQILQNQKSSNSNNRRSSSSNTNKTLETKSPQNPPKEPYSTVPTQTILIQPN